MPFYRLIVGTVDKEEKHELNELIIKADNGNNAYRQAIRCATKMSGVLTYLGLMEGPRDRILFQLGGSNESRRNNSGDIVPMEGSAPIKEAQPISEPDTGTNTEHPETSSSNPENI